MTRALTAIIISLIMLVSPGRIDGTPAIRVSAQTKPRTQIMESITLPQLDIAANDCRDGYNAHVDIDTILLDIAATDYVFNIENYIKKALAELDPPYEEPQYVPAFANVPMPMELQQYTEETCAAYGVDPQVIYAMILVESNFRDGLISATNDYGLMQINKCNHSWLKKELGLTDLLDPYQNIRAGVYMLSRYVSRYDLHKALMCYNMGEGGAGNAWRKGATDSYYSRLVVSKMAEFKRLV